MNKFTLAHVVWDCKYHIVLVPKYRYKGILSIVVDEKEHILRKTFYAASSSRIPSTNFLPDNTMGMIEEPVSLLQFF